MRDVEPHPRDFEVAHDSAALHAPGFIGQYRYAAVGGLNSVALGIRDGIFEQALLDAVVHVRQYAQSLLLEGAQHFGLGVHVLGTCTEGVQKIAQGLVQLDLQRLYVDAHVFQHPGWRVAGELLMLPPLSSNLAGQQLLPLVVSTGKLW